jgi:hypothetical protein
MTRNEHQMSRTENGRSVFVVGAGDGRDTAPNNDKAGPAEVPLSAGNVPARGQS